MDKVTYEIVEHDGGWAYRVAGSYSETFASHTDAQEAASRAAREQHLSGETEEISYQDAAGEEHDEVSDGGDRPDTEVVEGG